MMPAARILIKAAVEPVKVISKQEAIDRRLFGPVYHGTSGDINKLIETGFNPKFSVPKAINWLGLPQETANGYPFAAYQPGGNIPAPCHHLGFGLYFTTVKVIAIRYNGGTTKGLREFYLDIPNVLKINFGSPGNMIKWWFQNGYNPPEDILKKNDVQAWIKATGNLTRTLRSKYDAVHFLGKGLHRLLDGDQICVYDSSRIYVIDSKLSKEFEIGSKVIHNQKSWFTCLGYIEKMKFWQEHNIVRNIKVDNGEIAQKLGFPNYTIYYEDNERTGWPFIVHFVPPPKMRGIITGKENRQLTIKWAKGGIQSGYTIDELIPVGTK